MRRLALCHEWITTYGGSDQVAAAIASALNVDAVFAFAVRERLASELFPDVAVLPAGRLGRTRFALEHWQWLLPVMPFEWRRLDLDDYDVVVTSAHACVNAIRVRPDVVHVCYCHTPMRYAWEWRSELDRVPRPGRPLWPLIAAGFRRADYKWAQHVSHWIANSRTVAERIRSYYGREATVIHPPVDASYWTPGDRDERSDFFLWAGRLVGYKRPDVAVLAANLAAVPLVVAGSGPMLDKVRKLAGPTVRFVVDPTIDELRELYRRARAYIFPGVEDFGMTNVEAQACGCPVIAFAQGGATETVVHNETGLLYEKTGADELAHIMRSFEPEAFTRERLTSHASRFSVERFEREIRSYMDTVVGV